MANPIPFFKGYSQKITSGISTYKEKQVGTAKYGQMFN